ncbi:MAG: SDR family oxidoreductase [Bacteriovorax sp.]
MKIFITGGTGFLGQYLIRELAPHFKELIVLSRKDDPEFLRSFSNVRAVIGDITSPHVFESEEDQEAIMAGVDLIIHAAALYDIKASHSDCYLHNVVGTQNIIRLAKKIKNLKAFYYISTIAVGDDDSFYLEEDKLPVRTHFSDYYSETKYQAEKLVREMSSHITTRIIRPGIIVGDSENGRMDKIDGPYYFIEALKKHLWPLKALAFVPLSYNPSTKIPMIPVDHVARAISLLLKRDSFSLELKTYHLISSETPTIQEFLDDLNESLGIKTKYLPVAKNPLHNSLLKLLGIPKELVPFMFSKLSYDKTRTSEELPELSESKYSAYKNKLFGNP